MDLLAMMFSVGMAIVGSNLYTANMEDSNVSMFTIGVDGRLTSLAQPTVSAGPMPETFGVDPIGKAAYVLDYSNDSILQYSVSASGELTAASIAAVTTGAIPVQILLK